MKPRSAIIGISLLFCVATVAGVLVQGRRLDDLRSGEQQLRLELQKLNSIPTPQEIQPGESNGAGTHLSASPSPELLRLRNQVSMLSRRQRELAAVPAENERLRARLTGARTNSANALPPGYIRKSEARFAGYSTPEATLESMLWAMKNRDYTNLLASFTPEITRELLRQMDESGKTAEEYFQIWEEFPGMNVIRRSTTNDLIELKVEILPGEGSAPFRFRQINGEWKIDSH